MLPTELLIYKYVGETLIPKKLPRNQNFIKLAQEQINCFSQCKGKTLGELNEKLLELEGNSTDYRIKRGLAHVLRNTFARFEIISPLNPPLLRKKVFSQASLTQPIPDHRNQTLEYIASLLSNELKREVLIEEIITGLYADLHENRILTEFEEPTPECLIDRYNLSQVQGIFYRASNIIINAHRNDPGEYKLLFKYLKFFQLISYIEGDADTGFTITLDGPSSLFKPSTRYGLALAKMIPALLHISKWSLKSKLHIKDNFTGKINTFSFSLDDSCDLVSHYIKGKTYDSMLEESFVNRWLKMKTEWKLEREVELVPLSGSVMIPDFRLVHPDGRTFLLEIIGFWHPEYLRKKFYQVRKAEANNLILAISERLNLDKAGVKFSDTNAKIIWFTERLSPKAVLDLLD